MPDLLIDKSEGVLTLTMNRPEAKNALTGEMLEGLCAEMRGAEKDPEIGAILITGSRPGVLCGRRCEGLCG